MNKELYLIVGNIASGKSTYAKKLRDNGMPCLSMDGLRRMMSAGGYIFDPDLEPIIKEMDEKCFFTLISSGISFCMDDARLVRGATRHELIEIAHRFGYSVKCVLMPRLDRETSVKRRLKDPHGSYNRQRWEDVWEMFDCMYDKPTLSEGFDRLIKVKNENTK